MHKNLRIEVEPSVKLQEVLLVEFFDTRLESARDLKDCNWVDAFCIILITI